MRVQQQQHTHCKSWTQHTKSKAEQRHKTNENAHCSLSEEAINSNNIDKLFSLARIQMSATFADRMDLSLAPSLRFSTFNFKWFLNLSMSFGLCVRAFFHRYFTKWCCLVNIALLSIVKIMCVCARKLCALFSNEPIQTWFDSCMTVSDWLSITLHNDQSCRTIIIAIKCGCKLCFVWHRVKQRPTTPLKLASAKRTDNRIVCSRRRRRRRCTHESLCCSFDRAFRMRTCALRSLMKIDDIFFCCCCCSTSTGREWRWTCVYEHVWPFAVE